MSLCFCRACRCGSDRCLFFRHRSRALYSAPLFLVLAMGKCCRHWHGGITSHRGGKDASPAPMTGGVGTWRYMAPVSWLQSSPHCRSSCTVLELQVSQLARQRGDTVAQWPPRHLHPHEPVKAKEVVRNEAYTDRVDCPRAPGVHAADVLVSSRVAQSSP